MRGNAIGAHLVVFADCPAEKLTGPVDLVMEDADEDANRIRFDS